MKSTQEKIKNQEEKILKFKENSKNYLPELFNRRINNMYDHLLRLKLKDIEEKYEIEVKKSK